MGFTLSDIASKVYVVQNLDYLTGEKKLCDQLYAKENVEIPEDTEFFNIVKGYADVFHKLINPAPNVTRFLGNSSFRCQRGFPSFKKDGIVYVSKRNVDKRYIDKSGFVPTKLFDNKIFYYSNFIFNISLLFIINVLYKNSTSLLFKSILSYAYSKSIYLKSTTVMLL